MYIQGTTVRWLEKKCTFAFSLRLASTSAKVASLNHYHATCFPGLEKHLKRELESIEGIQDIAETSAGVSFSSLPESAYEATVSTRVGLHVLQRLAEGPLSPTHQPNQPSQARQRSARDYGSDFSRPDYNRRDERMRRLRATEETSGGDALYEFAKKVDWLQYCQPDTHVTVSARLLGEHTQQPQQPNSNPRERKRGRDDSRARDDGVSSGFRIASSQLIERRVRDAVCDQIRDRTGVRPKPPFVHPRGSRGHGEYDYDDENDAFHLNDNSRSSAKVFVEFPIFAIVHSNRLSLYRDLAGPSLHRRGYKSVIHKASLNEAWAAGLLYESEWHERANDSLGRGLTFVDPMCGSGTILIEALMMAAHVPPGVLRSRWPFQCWPDYDEVDWNNVVRRLKSRMRTLDGYFLGTDINKSSISLANQSIDTLQHGVSLFLSSIQSDNSEFKTKNGKFSDKKPPRDADSNFVFPQVHFRSGSCVDWPIESFLLTPVQASKQRAKAQNAASNPLSPKPAFVVCNPPWGLRLEENVEDSWKELGHFLRDNLGGSDAHILRGGPKSETSRHLGLMARKNTPLKIGGVNTVLSHYKVLPKRDGEQQYIQSTVEVSTSNEQ